jgi:hypothetical protein
LRRFASHLAGRRPEGRREGRDPLVAGARGARQGDGRNAQGIVVRTVSNGQLQPGQQTVAWDGSAGNRKPVAGGRYVARVTATNELGVVSLRSR